MPKVSVIMSVYNTKKEYLCKAIESILNQTFKDFEFIIVNDASTDETPKILEIYKDKRIIRIDNKINLGLTASLNKALKIANGKYIVRMDADDISHIDRVKIQYEYMEKNKSIAVLGTYAKQLGTKKILMPIKCIDHEHRRVKMIFRNSGVIHPTAMIRKSFLEKYNLYYDENIKKGQDYALWAEIVKYGKIANIEMPLLEYRVHKEQISMKCKEEQDKYAYQVKVKQIKAAQMPLTEEEIKQFIAIEEKEISNFKQLLGIINKVIKWNKKVNYYNQKYLEKELLTLWIVKVLRRVKCSRDFSGFLYLYTYTIFRPDKLRYFIFSFKNHEI